MELNKFEWKDENTGETPLSATNLNGMQDMINGNIDNLTTYSESEKVIGTWIDGKPLYRKVINAGNLSLSTTPTKVSANLYNPEYITKINFIYPFDNENIFYQIWNLKELSYSKIDNSVNIVTTSSANFINCKIIIEYTKTTD